MSRLPALVTSLMLPLPLWAETCPVAADLTTGGIAFEVDQGDVEVFWQKRPGLIESHYAYGGDMANAARAMLAHGIYVLELTDLENGKVVAGSRSAYSFPMPASEMPIPEDSTASDSSWSWQVAYNHNGDFGSETQVYSPQPEIQKTYGACSYQVIPIELRYGSATEGDLDLLHYLPDLGISYLARTIYSDGDDTYDYHSIRTVN